MNPPTNDKAMRGLLFALTPEGRAAAHAWINRDYAAKVERNRERQRRQARAQNEIEFTGEIEDGTGSY